MKTATARAHPNIAFIKYWGNRNEVLRLPMNSTISMNLASVYTDTSVTWDENLDQDILEINGTIASEQARLRVSDHLERIRRRLGLAIHAHVSSSNNFPMGAGIASSAAAFAALTVAAVAAAEEELTERELTTIARIGSGSASRSVPSGFVEWFAAETHEDSYAESFASPDYWNLVDVIAVVSQAHKKTGSQAGHRTASTSDLQEARVAGAQARFDVCRQAIINQDFATLATVVEEDSNLMHAVMMTSRPPLFYWQPPTLAIMEAVREWRADGVEVCYTLDAGPNVHCICTSDSVDEVRNRLGTLSGILDTLVATPGGPATLI
ncbi:diphosphomevalonate decarboxylase [Phototrophicus methaneseepsis]|uniref:diphosphomevalonate decarboxylase n=1 Tax=Phototrophicus methaneseepsis TaxID=2710758 RepID=A0A7S8E6F6_9CHLR|nr:diphosphomevalonate decarboxylase [Phototrophicus methaneseepsis]QPC81232.1 diphosphomevalonate decarboxylase [Phototrophicus methaneseepsis]